jgi:hypothetical protein
MDTMNRHQRRTANAKGSAGKLDPVIAIHEAGHAVARVLGAADFGLPAEKMISYIDVGTAENLGESYFDKSVMLKSQAVTYGPTLSAGLQAVFDRSTQGMDPSKLTKQHIVEAIKLAKDDGLDVAPWLRARMLISTLASVAEAKHTGRQVDDVWNSPECEGDLKGAVEDGIYACRIRPYSDHGRKSENAHPRRVCVSAYSRQHIGCDQPSDNHPART